MKLYHISDKNRGKQVTLSPKKLEVEGFLNGLGFRDFENNLPARICVAPSIAQCLLAIPQSSLDGRRGLYVYSTRAEKKNVRCGREWDSPLTGEKWLFTPHLFRLEKHLSGEVAIFINMWVYSDQYGYEPYLSKKDRLELMRIRLKGIRIFLRNNKEKIKDY